MNRGTNMPEFLPYLKQKKMGAGKGLVIARFYNFGVSFAYLLTFFHIV